MLLMLLTEIKHVTTNCYRLTLYPVGPIFTGDIYHIPHCHNGTNQVFDLDIYLLCEVKVTFISFFLEKQIVSSNKIHLFQNFGNR